MSGKEYDFISFEQGVERIQGCLDALGIDARQRDAVITSRDESSIKAREALKLDVVPHGIVKWQLPVYWEGKGAQFFISVAAPNTEIEEHCHSEGDGLRFVVGGSIRYNGQELGVGDWMFIPQGVNYSLSVGSMGAIMCYCYRCCCVAAA